ncbi:MASE3 domain-containing protein [Neopusillimonas aromaticivorans]|nr:MASE3 domain-containing protein [Neopusillimonas aromaticivorans]WJJ92548.1 MASE3 domain-containing protein [Neopusillimonas aromaticivorans]
MPESPTPPAALSRFVRTLHPDVQLPMRNALGWLGALALVMVLTILSPVGTTVDGIPYYLEWHALMEVASIVVAAMVFAVGWRSRARPGSVGMTFLATLFLAVALLDFAHTFSYAGMPGYFSPNAVDKHLNFWMSARLLAAFGLLIIALKPWHRHISITGKRAMLAIVMAATIGLQWVVIKHIDQMPRWFIEGEGLTPSRYMASFWSSC